MSDSDATVSTYLTAIAVEGKTPKTIHSYANSLSDFRRTGTRLGLPGAVEEYRVEHVYRFLGAVRERGASAAYQHRRHREVKAFFSWCKRIGEVEVNAFQQVPLVKLEQKVVQPFSQEDIARLIETLDRRKHTGCRNYALLLFLLDTGVRASECLTVELEDIDDAHSRVLIRHGKGLKQRWVGIGERAQRAVRDYIERFRGDSPGELFLTTRGDAMSSVGTLEVILRRIGICAGVTKVHPHRFRHTFATWAIQSGAREIDVQLLLGHADLTMTQRYARTYSSAQAVKAHAHLSPDSSNQWASSPRATPRRCASRLLRFHGLPLRRRCYRGLRARHPPLIDDPCFEPGRRSSRPTRVSASSVRSLMIRGD